MPKLHEILIYLLLSLSHSNPLIQVDNINFDFQSNNAIYHTTAHAD